MLWKTVNKNMPQRQLLRRKIRIDDMENAVKEKKNGKHMKLMIFKIKLVKHI